MRWGSGVTVLDDNILFMDILQWLLKEARGSVDINGSFSVTKLQIDK